MKSHRLSLRSFLLSIACLSLPLTGVFTRADRPAQAGHRAIPIRANAGTTFTLVPIDFDNEGRPIRFSHTFDGVLQINGLGNGTVHGDIVGIPQPDGNFTLEGSGVITTADGATTLRISLNGTTAPDASGNPFFGSVHYDIGFTGGTGLMEGVQGGRAAIDGVGLFAPDFSHGTATWILQGVVIGRGSRLQAVEGN